MAKPKIPNQKKKYQKLNKRLEGYVALVEQIYDTLNLEAAKIVENAGSAIEEGVPFSFSDYPETKKQIDKIRTQFTKDVSAVIHRGTSEEWKQSNLAQDLIANSVFKSYGANIDKKKYNILYQTNSDALKAFRDRKDKELNISQKIWNQSAVYKESLEAAISCAIENGTDAITLSKQISKYLIDFPSLQRDYSEKYGSAKHLKDCEYQSIRLARSEINMAYRNAEQERWTQMDFIVGYEIKLSGNHTLNGEPFTDICDELAGKYPKDFTWNGWHPNCRCYRVPIFNTEDEFWEWDGKNDIESVNEVKDVPDAFKQWVNDNQHRIDAAKERGTLPYFILDNEKTVGGISLYNSVKEMATKASVVGGEVQLLAESVAAENKGITTPINYKSIASMMRKVKTENMSPCDIKDAVRTTIIVPKESIENVLKQLSDNPSFVRVKRQTPDKFMGYSGNIINIKTSNGLIAELQVNTSKMIYAKEKPEDSKRILGEKEWNRIRKQVGVDGGLGHKYHEEARILNPITDKEKYVSIVKKSVAYYRIFQ